MKKILEETIKVKRWEWIPIFGTFAYVFRVEFFKAKIEDKKIRTNFGFYRSIFNLISIAIGIVFIVLLLTLRDTHGLGHWPWFFWLGLGIALFQNLTVAFPLLMFRAGITRAEKKQLFNPED